MPRRRAVLRAVGAGAVFGLGGCTGVSSSGSTDRGETRAITDGAGRTVAVPEAVERVVGVGPGALRQLAYLDATDRVVGVEDAENGWAKTVPYNLANPALRELPVIGSAGPNAGGNSEKILAVDPDVIFYYGDSSRAGSLQSQTETPVVVLNIVDIVDSAARETMYETWRLLGDILGKADRAEELVAFVEQTLADLDERTADVPAGERERAYVGAINYKGSHGIATTRKTFPPFAFVNVENVASGIGTDAASVQVSEEQLLTWDPETIFLGADNLQYVSDDLDSNAGIGRIDAIERGATYSILPHASYHHNYGSILANAYFVGQTVYPEQFDRSLESKTNAIFEALLGAPLYEQLIDAYDAYRQFDRDSLAAYEYK
jgi:iron complex transport system substrate-binding protein